MILLREAPWTPSCLCQSPNQSAALTADSLVHSGSGRITHCLVTLGSQVLG